MQISFILLTFVLKNCRLFIACKIGKQCKPVLWSSIFVTLVAKKYHESVTLPSGLRMVYDNH